MGGIVEIRTYTLKPGSGAEFHRTLVEDALPMLERWSTSSRSVLTDDDDAY
jgi:hypothetical protein